jgi:hypothetical protein
MKRKRHSDEPITFAPRQTESGTSEEEIRRRLRVSERTVALCRSIDVSAGAYTAGQFINNDALS